MFRQTAVALIFIASASNAHDRPAASVPIIAAATNPSPPVVVRQMILQEVRDKISQFYVFPDKRANLIAAINAADAAGRFNNLTDAQFGDALTNVMQDAVGDRHLALVFDPHWAADFASAPEGEDNAAFDAELTAANFGIQRTENLPGNIRYVRINAFGWVNDRTGQAYDGLMRFLRDGDAVIIDIRGNSGGDHNAVRYLVSHFLAADTLLYRFQSTRAAENDSRALNNLPAGRMIGKPLYVLIDRRTVSAGEDLAYQVQQYHLGTLVGSRTVGAANNNDYFLVGGQYRLSLSVGRPVHPVSHDNWEGAGIAPDMDVPAAEALDRAIIAASDRLQMAENIDPLRRMELRWSADNARARLTPTAYDARALQRLVGQYGDYGIVWRDGRLWMEMAQRDPLLLSPMAEPGLFALTGRDFVRLRFTGNLLHVTRLGAPEDIIEVRR